MHNIRRAPEAEEREQAKKVEVLASLVAQERLLVKLREG